MRRGSRSEKKAPGGRRDRIRSKPADVAEGGRGASEGDGFGAILRYVLGFLLILAALAFAIVGIWRLLS